MTAAIAARTGAARSVQATSNGAGRAEAARRRVVQLTLLILLLAVVEGSLRKYLLPGWGAWLFFIRDPLVLLAYAVATRNRLWPRGQPLLMLGLLMGAGAVLLVLLQVASGGASESRLLLAAYGWRNYFLYLPLAFLVGAVFSRNDLMRLFRWSLLLALPVLALVVLQFQAPADAAINVGTSADEALQFRATGLTADRIRPMGPFSSVAGLQQFVATGFAVALALLMTPRRAGRPAWPLLLAGTVALLGCAAFSGSRGTVLQCALALVFAAALVVFGRGAGSRMRAATVAGLLVLASALLLPLAAPQGLASFIERWQTAERIEARSFEGGIAVRALIGLVDFIPLIERVPLLGYGLGYGGNASTTLGARIDGVQPGSLAETDFSRHMVDLGPVAGTGYIGYRLLLAAWLVTITWRATRRSGDPLPMLLLSYVLYTVVMGQITGQGAINVYGWLYTGLLIAACRGSWSAAVLPADRPGGRKTAPARDPSTQRNRSPLQSRPASPRGAWSGR